MLRLCAFSVVLLGPYLARASVFRRRPFVFAGGVRVCPLAIEGPVRWRPFVCCIRHFNDFCDQNPQVRAVSDDGVCQ